MGGAGGEQNSELPVARQRAVQGHADTVTCDERVMGALVGHDATVSGVDDDVVGDGLVALVRRARLVIAVGLSFDVDADFAISRRGTDEITRRIGTNEVTDNRVLYLGGAV